MESHPNPEQALSDGPNSWPLDRIRELLETLMLIDQTVKRQGFAESELAV
jgi:2-dehydro-3-deoxyphosphooctonate aldolase (KDO 8-P synthase)